MGYIESGFDQAFSLTVVQHLGVDTLPEQQSQGTEQNGLTRPRLAGNDGEVSIKSDVRLAYQRIVLNMKGLEHGRE